MGKPNFRGPPYKGEINPLTGKPYSTNPRAHGARWKAWYNKKTPDGRKQGEVYEEWTKKEEYKKSKEYIKKKKEAEDRPRHTAQDQGEAVERAKEQMKIPTMKEQLERDETKINPEDDWQTNPDFDQEQGGWQEKAGDALRIGGKAYPFIRDALKILGGFNLQRAKADTTDIVDELMINPDLSDQLLASNVGDGIINALPRGGYYGNSHRDALKSGELTQDKLIESLKLAAPHLLEKADLPLHIRGGRMPGTIKGTPHIDSPFMDRYLQDYRKKENQNKGPQLPSFV